MKKGQFPLDKPGRKLDASPQGEEYIDIHQIQKHILESRADTALATITPIRGASTLNPPPYYPYNVQLPPTPGSSFIPEDCFNFWFNPTNSSTNQNSGKNN